MTQKNIATHAAAIESLIDEIFDVEGLLASNTIPSSPYNEGDALLDAKSEGWNINPSPSTTFSSRKKPHKGWIHQRLRSHPKPVNTIAKNLSKAKTRGVSAVTRSQRLHPHSLSSRKSIAC